MEVIYILVEMRIIKNVVYFGLRAFNRLIPKKQNQVMFASIPDFSDNAKALFEYNERNCSKFDMFWTVSDRSMVKKLQQKGIQAYAQHSFIGLYKFFRSKYVIVTHNDYGGLKTNNQVLINLWHGMPLKAVGFIDNSTDEKDLSDLKFGSEADDMLISTSAITKSSLVACFFIDSRKVYITGQPRNDRLFLKEDKGKLWKLLNEDISKYDKVVFFTPTFRQWGAKFKQGGTKIEGIPKTQNIFNFDDYDLNKFCDFLENNNTLFLIKFHPIEEMILRDKFKTYHKSDSIVLITTNMLQNDLLDVYDILGAVDILITDYSSLYFDFLLLNRPIIFVPTDLEEYSKSRGFALEPYDFWTPGPKVSNFGDFLEELKKSIDNPNYYENERKIINDIINKYKDNKSCERVWNECITLN